MTAPDFWADNVSASNTSRKYENLRSYYNSWLDFKNELGDFLCSAEMSENDEKMMTELNEKFSELEKRFSKMEFQVLFADKYDKNSAILSLHAGVGGVDAQDWTEILMRMYLRFCERHGFETKIIDKNDGAEAGIKSVTIEVTGLYAYGWLKSENGVHRLVRISPFDAEKMRHTSFALAEVLPEIEDDKVIEIKDEDLKIDVMRAGGHGGQSVNTTDSAVRITHLPTGIVVKCQNERSQLQNKMNAMKILKGKLAKIYSEQESEKLQQIKGEYRQAEWGNQARSYVMQPYQLVKDHRTEYETAEIDKVLDGEIDDFVENYLRLQAGKK